MEGAAVVMRLVTLILELALKLHANLDRLERVRRRYGSAGGDATRYEGALEGQSIHVRFHGGLFEGG